MHAANVPMDIHYRVWTEAFKTATLVDGLTAIMLDNKMATRFEHRGGKHPDFANHLRTWERQAL